MWWYPSLPACCLPASSCLTNPSLVALLSNQSGILYSSGGMSAHSVTAPVGSASATASLNSELSSGSSGAEMNV